MEQVKKRSSAVQFALVGLKLLLICAIVAGVVSFVYSLTAEPYENNIRDAKSRAVGEIFGLSAPVCEELTADGVTAPVYRVLENGVTVGYCVEVKSPGFGGDIEMTVGYTPEGKILGVSIVSLSETPGLGAKVSEDAFLSQYDGKQGTLTLGEDIDAISGATISSRAVTDGVNAATEILQKVLAANGGVNP